MIQDPNSGRLLANRYKLVELAGKGAMGQVYRAEDLLLGSVTVAVKFLAQTLLNQKMRDRFVREATVCALLAEKSIHIVRVRDYGVDERDIPYYVMEFLEGNNLSDIIKTQRLTITRFIALTRQICLGLEAAHQGITFNREIAKIVHRDIKPSNILILPDTTLGELVKILDFGIAKLIEANQEQTHSFMGTLAYCSPEQIEGKELDNRSDIYSLGIMMYEMLSGEMPILPATPSFGGWYKAHHNTPPKSFPPELKIPSELEALIHQCLAKDPSQRPQSASEILSALEGLELQDPRYPKRERSRFPVPVQEVAAPTIESLCMRATWPTDKPKKQIVFPEAISTSQGRIATLWVMLSEQDIFNRRQSTRYNQFLFLASPHPMLLWITVLYSRDRGARWLPCYLDLKQSKGQRLARQLGKSGAYRILFFALEDPHQCKHVMVSTIDPTQCKMLINWADTSQTLPSVSNPQTSKNILRQEYDTLKPKIEMKLESVQTNYPEDIH
ncbi:serine/threonine-protein kinase [Oscillatoria sp. FACHB-1406]|uniref:serine/threonine protein kinase n=1 Tax=Oscillatoria sp. FACHB-1406 TaxID=2692846 RepID=UPI0016898BCF|nr:serine/threonine-protein kinase [Oscillatoria sp. FACHB-1406]MBD2576617.1 serine/threonine protein kinase [Oscillatoria sp. FACHB-1406]